LAVHGTQINRKVDKNKTVKTTLPLDFAEWKLVRAGVQSFTSQRRFSIRGISRVTWGYFLTLLAIYSLVSSVTYLQILTTNLFCGKCYKFQFLKISLVWKFRNNIFAFKTITHYRIFLIFHHSCRASFPIDTWNKKDRSPTSFLR
jgi:hypothetical protein